jgi:hypothetical protein
MILSVGGKIQARRFRDAPIQWDTGDPPRAGSAPVRQRITVPGVRPAAFYRVHFKISGPMTVGRRASMYVAGEASAPSGDALEVDLSLPLCGELRAHGRCRVRDIFGLTGAGIGGDMERTLTVQPPPFTSERTYRVEAAGGFEEKTRQRISDEERYYMREYIPGDRFRDINWKASSRLTQLITRISPYTQEKTKLLPVELRNYRADRPETVESLVHLNVVKSWLLFFLRKMKQDDPRVSFLVGSGRGIVRLETEEDIDRFSVELGGLHFQDENEVTHPRMEDHPDLPGDAESGRLFVFSTPYDRGLQRRLHASRSMRVRVFMTRAGAGAAGGDGSGGGNGFGGAGVRLFTSAGTMPLPGWWVFRRDRHMTAPAGDRDGERTVFDKKNIPAHFVTNPQGEDDTMTSYSLETYPVYVRLF